MVREPTTDAIIIGKHAARLVGSDARTAHLHNLAIIGGLAVCIAVMVLVSKMARKAAGGAVGDGNPPRRSVIPGRPSRDRDCRTADQRAPCDPGAVEPDRACRVYGRAGVQLVQRQGHLRCGRAISAGAL